MKGIIVVALVVSAAVAVARSGENTESSSVVSGTSSPHGTNKATYAGNVVEIEIGGENLKDLGKFEQWGKVLDEVEDAEARAVILRINAAEGYLRETEQLMERLLSLKVPSYALIEKQALGEGALLALAATSIFMAPDSIIGGAGLFSSEEEGDTGDREQHHSRLLATIRRVASGQGHSPELIQALFKPGDRERRFGEVLVPAGTVLTLTAKEAVSQVDGESLLAAAVVGAPRDLLSEVGLSGVELVSARSVSGPAAAGIAPSNKEEASINQPEDLEIQQEEPELPGKIQEESFEGKLVVLTVGKDDLMNKQSFKFWRRMMRRAEDEKAKAVLFDLDTPGGYAFETKEIMSEITRLKIPSYAFVNENALSAGALMSVATNGIYMSPEGTIGAAGLVSGGGAEIGEMMRKKLHSSFEAQIRSVAEKRGHDPELIRAMMIPEDRDRVFGEVVVRAGELLTLTASEATSMRGGRPLLAKGVASSIEEIAELEGIDSTSIVRAEATAFENVAWWVSKWSFLLILVGMAAAYAELKAPGFGIGGAISLLAFGTFFFGNYMAGNLANYELVALFVLGIVLIAVELFLIPGTGVTGIAGVLCLLGALLLGTVDKIDWNDWKVGDFSGNLLDLLRGPAFTLGTGLLGGSFLVILLMRFLPSAPLFRFFVSKQELVGGASIETQESSAGSEDLVGQTGEALTDLRPSGKVAVTGGELDVIADGAFIRKGSKVRVLRQDGMKIVVGIVESA